MSSLRRQIGIILFKMSFVFVMVVGVWLFWPKLAPIVTEMLLPERFKPKRAPIAPEPEKSEASPPAWDPQKEALPPSMTPIKSALTQ